MNIAELHFIRPYWLLALLPYFFLLFRLAKTNLSHANWTAVCDAALLPYLLQDKAVMKSRWPLITGALAAFLAIIALAGPTWQRLPTPVFRNDSALVIVLDLSTSMAATDIKPSRLVMARYKIADILKQRKDGQTALIAFAGDAFTVTPLTNDTDTIDNQLSALSIDIMPNQGNNTAMALEKANELLQQAGLRKGQVLLLTDGGNAEGAIAEVKKTDAYQLLVLGVGTSSGAPIALATGGFLKDEQGNIVIDKLDVNSLEKLAYAGRGIYQPIMSDDSDIKNLLTHSSLNADSKGEKNERLMLDHWRDFGPWLLLVILPLVALHFRKGILVIGFLLLVPFPKNSQAIGLPKSWEDLWETKDQQAQKAYNSKLYGKAAEQFDNPSWKAAAHYQNAAYDKALENLKNPKDADGYYNQGNTLAQSGKLQEALAAYNQALKLNPNDADTKYNKEIVEKALEQQKQQQQNQQQDQNQQDKQDKKEDSKDNKDQQQSQGGNQSNQAQQNQEHDHQKDQQESGQQAESKKEQSQQSTEAQPEKKENAEPQKQKPELTQPQQAQQAEKQKQAGKPETAMAEPLSTMSKEEQQAHEQWLKRIPDDPAGLLKRKFKYQYDQLRR